MSTLEELRSVLAAERGLLAGSLADPPANGAAFGPLVASGTRTRSAAPEYALLVESIFEGYLLHYAHGRVVAAADDEDLRLLAGDHLYALGLERLAAIGDLDAVDELADLISLCAHVHAHLPNGGAPPWSTASALWALAALAVAHGGWDQQREAKQRARELAPDAAPRALSAAWERAATLGVEQSLEHALIAFEAAVTGATSTT
jgi:hypothetical protein